MKGILVITFLLYTTVLVATRSVRSNEQKCSPSLNGTNAPFCSKYVSWPVAQLEDIAQAALDLQAKEAATTTKPEGANQKCEDQLNKLACAVSFMKCEENRDLMPPCNGDCTEVTQTCNITITIAHWCTANSTQPCNLLFNDGPNLALIILVPIVIIGALVVTVAVIAVVFFMFKKKDNYSSV